ncbi:MAG: MnmC family methyltransferase [Enterobacter hormaechei]
MESAPVQRNGTSGTPGATLATFTSAGFVRRGLQEAGLPCGKPKALAANATCWWGDGTGSGDPGTGTLVCSPPQCVA